MKKIIDGQVYYQDAIGKLYPEEVMKPQDILRDDLVTKLAEKYLKMREDVINTKATMLAYIANYRELAAAKYGVKPNKKDNAPVTLNSFDGKLRITITTNTKKEFNENVATAKQLLDEYLDEELKSTGASQDLRVLVTDAFKLRQGELDFKAVWNLTKLNIKNPKFVKAVEIIKESIVVRDCDPSLRVYVRDENGVYQYLPTDFSTLRAVENAEKPQKETQKQDE